MEHGPGRAAPGPILRNLITAGMLLLVAWVLPALAAAGADHPAPRAYVTQRQEGVVIQTDWTTCGPAAVATLLSTYFGIPATEGEVIALARPIFRERRSGPGRVHHGRAPRDPAEPRVSSAKATRWTSRPW